MTNHLFPYLFNRSLAVALALISLPMHGQRLQQDLGRGVVATVRNNNVNVTWRRLAQDPEGARYNLYIDKTGSGNYTKIATNLRLSNYQTTTSAIPYGSKVAVALVDEGGNETSKSVPFVFKNNTWNNACVRVNFAEAGSPIADNGDDTFSPKYCWPVDLDGDGEMEFVINRVYNRKDHNGYEGYGDDKLGGDCLEAYTREGKHLWTVNLGIHFFAFGGQNDGVTVGDFDGDGKGEVIVEVCEGARFWDTEKKTFGKYLYYNGQQASSEGGTQMVTVSSDGTDPDIDGDGMVNYTYYSKGKNPQHYMAVIEGMTGEQKACVAMTMPHDSKDNFQYTRVDKSDFYNDEYPYMSAAMGSAFLDGVHQSAVAQFQLRTSSKGPHKYTDGCHHYFTYAYGYVNGEFKELFTFAFHDNGDPSEFHHIRIGDVDGDGRDEVMNGAYALDHDGKVLWNSGICHGDRFRMSDIDPDRPGQEIFAIQQNAPDMLGMILYDARTGEGIKRWYMPQVGDVGRGECMDVDPNHKGYEMWSTMANMYNAKGEVIRSNHPYPCEGMWWDDDLGRECAWSPGSGNTPAMVIGKYDGGTGYTRQIQMSSEAGWATVGCTGVRPLFWGDILGDWREEIILNWRVDGKFVGFVVYTTDYKSTDKNIYCLLQDPNYFGQITNRGYYQSPNTSFYLGYDMPRPPLPPFIKADAETALYDLTLGDAEIQAPASGIKNMYAMPVIGQTLTLNAALPETLTLWKSQEGSLVLNGDADCNMFISQGTLEVNGQVTANVDLRARGILSGKGSVESLTMEGALNYAEGVIRPSETLSVGSDLTVNVPCFVEIDIDKGTLLKVNGALKVTGSLTFNIDSKAFAEGTYKLIEYTGEFSGDMANCSVRGVVGMAYELVNENGAISLVIKGQREAEDEVVWSGNASKTWNYTDENWQIEGLAASFVSGDGVIFSDGTTNTTVEIPELIAPKTVEVNSTQNYTFTGNGGFTGNCTLTKNGSGKLTLACKNSDYTGGTVINEGTVVLKELSMQGSASSIGVGATSPARWKVRKATMVFDGASMATDRGINLLDTATFHIPGSYSTTVKGNITGSSGVLRKTGAGQLSVSSASANTWKSTILDQGTIALGTTTATLGNSSGLVHVTGNSKIVQFYSTSSGGSTTFQNPVEIDSAKTLTFVGTGRGAFKSALTGKGTISLSSAYVRFDIYPAYTNFEGTLSLGSGANRIVSAISMKKGILDVQKDANASGVKAGGNEAASYTHQVGGISGEGTLSNSTWNIGGSGLTSTFAGTIGSGASANIVGDCHLILTGESPVGMNVKVGELLANNTKAATLGGTINVSEGGILGGSGIVNNVTVAADGTVGTGSLVAGGNTQTILCKTLTVNGKLTVNSGTVRVRYTDSSNDKIKNVGDVKLVSPTFVIMPISEKGTPLAGERTFKVFTGTGAITIEGDVTISPAVPCEGYMWDTSKLASEGTISIIADPVGIETIEAASIAKNSQIYDIEGRVVKTISESGIYIVNGQKVFIKR